MRAAAANKATAGNAANIWREKRCTSPYIHYLYNNVIVIIRVPTGPGKVTLLITSEVHNTSQAR